jgi:hypothetical protein
VVTGVNPNSGTTSGGTSVHISGAGFTGATGVSFGGVAASFTVDSDAAITATSPAHPAGAVDVRVTGPTGTSASSFADVYTYKRPPTVSSVVPNAGPTAGGNTVTINGGNFVSGATVKFSTTASPLVTFVSSTQLKAKVPAHAAGTVNVTVRTPVALSAISNGDLYAYGVPAVTSVVPNAGSTAGGNTVTITGHGLVPGATVKFGTVAATTVTFVSGTQIKAKVPAQSAGNVNVRVTTAAGTSAISNGSQYAYGAPAVSSLSPRSGTHAGGTTVTITGQRFVPGATVKFGTTPATSVTFVSNSQIKAKAPAHTAGTVGVRVTTPAGTSPAVSGDVYTYTP